MADVLSQSEVESLLPVVGTGAGGASCQPERDDEAPTAPNGMIDDRRLERVSPKRASPRQMRAMRAVHEGICGNFSDGLSRLARAIVDVKLINLDQLAYGEFVGGLENPSFLNLLRADSLEGQMILDLNPSIVFPILDRLLGEVQTPMRGSTARRPLTEIELQLATHITGLGITALDNAWADIFELKLRVTQVESNPQLVQIVPLNEFVVAASFEISLEGLRGIMSLCIPCRMVETLLGAQSPTDSSSSQKPSGRREARNRESDISNAVVEMIVYLAGTRLAADELSGLSVGDTIVTDNDCREPLEICIDGRPRFCGLAGLVNGHKAVRIGRSMTNDE
jgi:flagellar motor switch protein FliM